jgi:membrane-associated phospholipid phosphatase
VGDAPLRPCRHGRWRRVDRTIERSHRQTGTIDPATDDLTRRRASTLLLVAVACVVGLMVLYGLAVHTGIGQHVDDDALLGRSMNPRVQHATNHLLHTIDVSSLALIGGAIVLGALARARLRLALGAATLIVGATATTEALKHLLTRPPLLHPDPLPIASFPSGHTTVAFSLALALLLVVPGRWRGPTAVAAALYASAVGVATVTAAWHRPSDVIGAFLVTVAWAAATCAVLLAEWGPGSGAGRRDARRGQRLAVPLLGVSAVLLALVGFAVASTVEALGDRHLEAVSIGASYAGSVAAILAAGQALVAVLLWCLRDVSLDDPRAPESIEVGAGR